MIMQEGKLYCALSLKYNALLHDNAPGAVVTYFLNGARPSNLKFFNIASSKQMVERVPSKNAPSAIHNDSASAVDQDLQEAQGILSARESEESPTKRIKLGRGKYDMTLILADVRLDNDHICKAQLTQLANMLSDGS